MSPLAEDLLLEFLYQKKQLAEHAGVKHTPIPNWARAVNIWGSHMESMAKMVRDWDLPPAVVMQAAFDQAKRNRHPDGPQITMLKSDKYLTNALSMYLDLPVAAVRERRSKALMLELMDKEYEEVIFPDDLLSFTVENVCFRYAEARRRGEDVVAVILAPDVLSRVADDRRLDTWLEHRGYPYMEIARHYNRIIDEVMPNNPKLPNEQYQL